MSNNNVRIILDKNKDKTAIARRYCIVDVRYLNGLSVADYMDYFREHTTDFFEIYAAFFAYCYYLAKDGDLQPMQNKITTENINRVSSLYYFNNDDEIIIENFRKWCDDPTFDLGPNGFASDNVHFLSEINGEATIFFRCNFTDFSPKLQKSEKYIKHSVLTNSFPSIKFGKL